jgi:hypothetical protein
MPPDTPMTKMRTGRPWWVGPGIGALVGAAVIAVVAHGSLAAGPVSLPAGPRLAPAALTRPSVPTPDTGPSATVVTPLRPVVSETSGGEGAGGSSGVGYGGVHASGGTESAPSSGTPATAPAAEVGSTDAPAPESGATSPPPTATPVTTTTTTTTVEREPKDR